MYHLNLIFCLCLQSLSSTPYENGITLSRAGDYEASEAQLEQVAEADRDSKYYFYREFNNYQLNNKVEGLRWADELLNPDFRAEPRKIPIRYEAVGALLRADMENWKTNEDDLENVSRQMTKVRDRLGTYKGGPKTQELEKKILAGIDANIKKMEDQAKKQNQANSDKQGSSGKTSKDVSGKNLKNSPADSPAADSGITAQEQAKGSIDRRKMQEVAQKWGTLPAKDRAAAMKELTRNLNPELRDTVEKYFKSLEVIDEDNDK